MAIAGRGGSVKVFNALAHGVNTASIIRMDIPWWESLIGLVATAVLAWLMGTCIAAIYNLLNGKTE
jgi:hypothetical protein